MNVLPLKRKALVLSAITEGTSIRGASRLTGVQKNTIIKLICDTAEKCWAISDSKLNGIQANDLQCDELWSFVGKRDKRLYGHERPYLGSQFIFVALEAQTKPIPCFTVGKRDLYTATKFMRDLRKRVSGRPQLTTDAFQAYHTAVRLAFGSDVDYARLAKSFANNGTPRREGYAPSDFRAIKPVVISGNPDPNKISTSYVERQNLTLRMQMRRFTRLTNAFSKKLPNLRAALWLHFTYYNFCRVHQMLGVTPAMASNISDYPWNWREILSWQAQ